MNALRSLAFVIWMYGLMVVMGVLCAPSLLMSRQAVRACFDVWFKLVLWGLRVFCGLTYELRGAANVPEGGALIAMKHQSMFDTLAPWQFLKDPCIILKKSLIFLPIFGWYALRLKNIPIDRAGGAKTLKAMTKLAKVRAEEGRQVLIFPEGTRGWPGEKIAYKPGIALLYAEMGVPCVPIAVNSGLYWPPHGFERRPGKIIVEVLPAIPPGLKRAEFMRELEARIETASDALLDESVPRGAGAAANTKSPA